MRVDPGAARRIAVPLTLTPDEARPRDGRDVTLSGPTMGVTWVLRARAPAEISDAGLRSAVQGACDAVVAEASTWERDSDLCRFNRAPAGTWVAVGRHLTDIVARALELAELSQGAFDPALGRLVDSWGFGPAGPVTHLPSRETATGEGRPGLRSDWRGLRVDHAHSRLFQPGGAALDLSGIAKGYGVDLAVRAVRALGVRDVLIDIGGELAGFGVKGSGEPWWIEVERPPDCDLQAPPIMIALHGFAVASSGDWRRSFEAGGRRYSHTLDPATAAPVSGVLAAVTVAHATAMDADGLCTALIAMGEGAGAFAADQGIAAILLYRTADGYVERVSPAFARLLD